jgi:hypothetical protein
MTGGGDREQVAVPPIRGLDSDDPGRLTWKFKIPRYLENVKIPTEIRLLPQTFVRRVFGRGLVFTPEIQISDFEYSSRFREANRFRS